MFLRALLFACLPSCLWYVSSSTHWSFQETHLWGSNC
jgi:hypothetical protein